MKTRHTRKLRRAAWAIALGFTLVGVSLWAHGVVWIRGMTYESEHPIVSRVANMASAPGTAVFAVTDRLARGRLDPRRWNHAALVHGGSGAVLVVGVFAILSIRGWLSTIGYRDDNDHDSDTDQARVRRRKLLIDSGAAVLAAPAVGAWAYGACVEPWNLQVRRYRIAIDDLPPELEGLRIGHCSDPHVGPRVAPELVRRAVGALIDERPDLIALTGDYVDRRPSEADAAAALLAPLASVAPVAAVLGNHDWYTGARHVREALSGVGVRFIDNAHAYFDRNQRTITTHAAPGALRLVGAGDATTGRARPVRPRLRGEHRERAPATLMLTHNPDAAEDPRLARHDAPRTDLMLAGHTHGGQIALPLIGAPILNIRHGTKYAGGLVQAPAFRAIVSRGVGMSFLPIRLGVPPEVGVIELFRG